MKRIVFVTPDDSSHGFGLAGVRHVVARGDRLSETLLALASDSSTGVLALDQRLVNGPIQRQLDVIEQRSPAVVVIVPAPTTEPASVDDYALRLIRRAIGYQVRVGP
jgi:vacuolar-type H+-ATPase subunit F/Vma7